MNTYAPQALGEGQLNLLQNISLEVQQNDIIGLVGETGSGKSVLINSIGRNLEPPLWQETAELTLNLNGSRENLLDKDGEGLESIWGAGIAFIPPNARDRLNPIMKVGEQVSNIIQARSEISPEAADEKVIEMFALVGMPAPETSFNSYPHELSGGMAQRVIISVALSMTPKLLLADEPTMGLDVTIQAQVLDLMADLLRTEFRGGAILATRDLGTVANYCNRVAVLCNGQLVEFADVREFFSNATHPYSEYLLKAAFATHEQRSWDEFGSAKSKDEIESHRENSCRFAARCPIVEEICWSADPATTSIGEAHQIRCHVLG